ncbi:hypothetical protein MRS44_013746 [Fusarium solani]|uniref:uncharacterized protein n=1 Tax=Fusarium solani TaxID=169388 RepID=UPI0032C41312|nr:hypothetical protein MRS44_013746 [Fusarium solani]
MGASRWRARRMVEKGMHHITLYFHVVLRQQESYVFHSFTPPTQGLQRCVAGAVPFIQDDAQKPPLLLSESRAIARYLALRYSTSTGRNPMLVPDAGDFIGLAKFEEAASIELTCFDAAANPLVFEEYFKLRYSNRAADTERCKALRERLNDVLTLLDNRLAGQQFMAGERSQTVTLVDFFYVPYMHYLATHVWPSVLDGRQHLGAWWKMMQGRDSYRVVFGQQAAN